MVCSAKRLKALEDQAEKYDIKDIMYCLTRLQSAFPAMQTGNRRSEMEMTVIRMCDPSLSADIESLEQRVSRLENGVMKTAPAKAAVPVEEKAEKKVETAPAEVEDDDEIPPPLYENEAPAEEITQTVPETKPETVQTPSADGICEVTEWGGILNILMKECPIIGGVLNGSKAYIKGDFLLIDAPNSQFRSLINSRNGYYKDSIRKAAFSVLGATYKLGPYTKPSVQSESDPLTAFAEKLKNFEIN